MDIEGGEEYIFAINQNLSYLNKIRGMAYEIHSSAGLNLLNSQLFKLGLKPGKIYYDNDFRNKIIKRFLKPPNM